MSAISKVILELKEKDALSHEEQQKLMQNSYNAFNDLVDKIITNRAESKNSMENIVRNCLELEANKHTIKNALEKTEGIKGLPVSLESHKNVIDLLAKSVEFVNKTDVYSECTSISTNEFQQKIGSSSEFLANDFKDLTAEVNQTQNLYHKAKILKDIYSEADQF